MASYFNRPYLYCSSHNLLESLLEATPFCTITGVVFEYILFQIAVLWILHILAFFWKIKFPFHARSFVRENKIKYIHFTCVIVALLLPITPVITSMADFAVGFKCNEFLQNRNITFWSSGMGYGIGRFPPILCLSTNSDVLFYSLILPIDSTLFVGITILIFLLWTIREVS